jgi:hypothetical protein
MCYLQFLYYKWAHEKRGGIGVKTRNNYFFVIFGFEKKG